MRSYPEYSPEELARRQAESAARRALEEAAPELLDLLRKTTAALEASPVRSEAARIVRELLIGDARALIAKAEGRKL